MSDMEKLILEHTKVMREQLTEQGKALKRMSAKLTEMMAEDATCNDLEQEEESQPLDYSLLVDVNVEEVDKSENVNHNSILKLGHISPHSKHFLTLCLVGNLEIEPPKPMEKCVDEEQCP
ncbi:hypothetical protein HAX54_023375 [Datura stramonium]|uniref:Uncharacterized protein n=1 Tax=Datura stramonium TaxID=4076 RepID=A0ABS8S4X8_DATST|nr:hypothetical protein [Datura stramonium]